MIKQEAYHYTECGLDNVYLYNIPKLTDCKNEGVIYIPKINKLHNLIAKTLLEKPSLLNGKEIRFLRTRAGLKQAELAEKIGKDAQSVGRWERENNPADKTTDKLLRIVIAEELGMLKDINLTEFIQLDYATPANDNINISGDDIRGDEVNDYKLMAA